MLAGNGAEAAPAAELRALLARLEDYNEPDPAAALRQNPSWHAILGHLTLVEALLASRQ